MEKCFVVHSSSLGDTICSTPTLKKLSKIYGEKFHVATHVSEVFLNNPYVEKIINPDSIDKENYEIFETFRGAGKKDKSGIEKKHNTIDIRQFHAMDLGFSLLPEEMECEFYPDIHEDLQLPSDYICIHPTQTWESRTWAEEKWQELVDELIRMGVCVVLVGKDSQEFGFWDIKKPTFNIEGGAKVINLLNKTNLSSTWNVIDNASCFITMDSGLLHLAGTTDTHIIQLGSSINYKLRAPYRKGFQGYKYDYVGGTCDIFCGSDMKYGIKEWGTIHGVPPIIKCLEDKPTYECHPSVDQVIDRLSKDNIKIFKNKNITRESYEDIWEKTIEISKLESIVGGASSENRKSVHRLFSREAETILDVACGVGAEYIELQKLRPDLKYTGLDITPKYVSHCQDKGLNVLLGTANDIPFEDNSFDIVHTRHSLEHLKDFRKAVSEFIRVAKESVYISFFFRPLKGIKKIALVGSPAHYGNQYDKLEIEKFLNSIVKVKDYQWIEIFKGVLLKIDVSSKNKRILYLTPHLSTGGSPEWLRKAIESIKDNFEIFVVEFSLYADTFIVQRKKIIEMIGKNKFYSLGSVFDDMKTHVKNRWKLINIIDEIQPDVVHINEMPEMFEYNGFPDEILSELYKEDRSYRIYETSHCSTYKPDETKRYIPDGFIHCSPLHFEQYRNFDVPQYLAEYPVEKKERLNRKETLEELGLNPDEKHVLQVGLFTIGKNQKYTFELANTTQDLGVQYHFVGNHCWTDGCNIPDGHMSLPNCKIWGERNDVDAFMGCMDILIFPSLVELNPIVLKEADSWDMNIFLNDIEAYTGAYKENKNVTFMTLDLERDKEILIRLLE